MTSPPVPKHIELHTPIALPSAEPSDSRWIECNIKQREEQIDGVGPWWWLWYEEGLRFEEGSWEGPSREWPQLREKVIPLLRGTDTVLTAGGCQGMYPKLWAKHFRQVVALEPCPMTFQVMEKNCEGSQYRLIMAALGAKAAKGSLHLCGRENVGMFSLVRPTDFQVNDVDIVRVDDLGLEALDLLQLDIEGSEPYALLGAEQTIDRFRPIIVVETVDGTVGEILSRHGYQAAGYVVSDTIYGPKET